MKAKSIALLLSSFLTINAYANTEQINLNKATINELTGSFKGIGKKRAEAIVNYREQHQGIKSVDELADIKGFSQNFVDKNKDKLKETFTVQ